MLVLIVLPFVVLILMMFVIRTMRGFRRASELRQQRTELTLPLEHRRPSDEFHDRIWLPLCERVAAAAESKLGRSLDRKERRIIWRSRSEVVLEAALQEIEGAHSAEAVTSLLARLPSGMDRPDPTRWCER